MRKTTPQTFSSPKQTLIITILALLIIGIAPVWFYFVYTYYYENKIFPNIKIATIAVGGLTKEQAFVKISQKIAPIETQGITFFYKQTSTKITPNVIFTAQGDGYRIINFPIQDSVEKAFQIGREENIIKKIKTLSNLHKQPQIISINIQINRQELNKILKAEFSQFETPPQNAQIIIDKNLNINLTKEKLGQIFDYLQTINQTALMLSRLQNNPLQMIMLRENPQIFSQDIKKHLPKIKKILEIPEITLTYQDKKYKIPRDIYKNWLSISILSEHFKDKQTKLIFSKKKSQEFFDKISKDINISPQNAKFVLENNRVTEFIPSQNGQTVNQEKTLQKIIAKIPAEQNPKIEIDIAVTAPQITTGASNEFGIKEIIGTGESNFRYSPLNRVHNIRTGAAALNGLLIKQGEEFSLLSAIGKVDGTHGYKKELVIKGGKTIPEYGGGLCQIGTTAFRTAIESGLPITQRANHSYRVSYYEPAGTDATIYFPAPDFKFINDTTSHILIQTRIEGTKLIFNFWGTKDNRLVEKTTPIIWDITPPPPTKIIETNDLKPKEKKCTEHAHNGARAKFDYKVTYPDGQIKEKTFYSHYIPWQEVCLVGIDPAAQKPNSPNQSLNQQPQTPPPFSQEYLSQGFLR